MNYWILPSNEDKFRLSDLLKVSNRVDWKQKYNFEVGDTVFIYNSTPLHRIVYQMYVERVDVPATEYLNDKSFWIDKEECEKGLKDNRFVRLRLTAEAPDKSKLTFDDLRRNGLKSNLQGAMTIKDNKLSYYIKKQIQNETKEKIARICWNSNGWEFPSGRSGKTENESFESEHGFGHEEWLLDKRKIYSEGYHYAFLEPLLKSSFEGTCDIHLYTYTPENKKLYIGCIRDAEYVNKDVAAKVWKDYENRGWDKEMYDDLNKHNLSPTALFPYIFNVRFRFENFEDYRDKEFYLRKDDPNTTNKHYVLLNKREPFLFETTNQAIKDDDFEGINDPNHQIEEGAKTQVVVNRYERNPKARRECLEANGYTCKVCGMNFEKVYGEIGKNFIHVHHIIPISRIGRDYQIDPVNELVPVCPNCHAMLHHGKNGKVLTVEELQKKMQKK